MISRPFHRSLLAAIVLFASTVYAQDTQLSQFYAAPMYLNPALTGNTHQDRISMNHRIQWPGIGPGYRTYAMAYDHRSSTTNSGIGGMVMHDRAGTMALSNTHVALCYSYEARINRRSGVRGGLRLGFTQKALDLNHLVFADQVIREANSSVEPFLIERLSYFDANAGLLYFNERFWAGISMNHLNRPRQSFMIAGDERLPIRTSVHTGYRFPVDGNALNVSSTIMTLATHYKAQGKWDQFDVGAYLDHRGLIMGLWYRGIPGLKAYAPGYANDEALILMVGVEAKNQLKVVYSYDITVSRLSTRSGGAHEVSLIYEWPRKNKSRRWKAVPCPKF